MSLTPVRSMEGNSDQTLAPISYSLPSSGPFTGTRNDLSSDQSARPADEAPMDIDISPSLRRGSYVITTFPWRTDMPVRGEPFTKVFEEDDVILKLARRMDNFERSLSTTTDKNYQDLRDMLAAQPEERIPAMSRPLAIKICNYLSLVRVLDDRYSRTYVSSEVPIHPKAVVIPYKHSDKLRNWHQILLNCREIIERLSLLSDNQTASCNASSSQTPSNRFVALRRHGEILKNAGRATNILENFWCATVALAMVIGNESGEHTSDLPEVPDNEEEFYKRLGELEQSEDVGPHQIPLGPEDGKTRPKRYMKTALSVGSLISWITLLLDVLLASTHVDKKTLILASKAIGNDKPKALIKVEGIILDAVIDAVRNPKPPLDSLKEIMSKIDWAEVDAAGEADWFTRAPAKKSIVTLFDSTASKTPENWPNPGHLSNPKDHTVPTSDPLVSNATGPNDNVQGDQPKDNGNAGGMKVADYSEPRESEADRESVPRTMSRTETSAYEGGKEAPDVYSQASGSQLPDTLHLKPYNTRLPKPSKEKNAQQSTTPTSSKPIASSSKRKKTKLRPAKKVSVVEGSEDGEVISYQTKELENLDVIDLTNLPELPPELQHIESGPEKVNLNIKNKPPKYTHPSGQPLTVHNVHGEAETFEPRLHFKEDATALYDMVEAAKKATCTEGRPNYLSNDTSVRESSNVRIMTDADFSSLQAALLLHLIQDKVIVVTGCEIRAKAFDESGLSNLSLLDAPTDIQDHSLRPRSRTYQNIVKRGTLLQLLSASDDVNGKILNALNFPIGLMGANPTSLSSETYAWMATNGLPFCKEIQVPVAYLRWGTASTRDAFHPWHADNGGVAVFFGPDNGKKLVFIAIPKKDQPDVFNSSNIFLGGFNPRLPCSELWDIEYICLTPGDRVIFGPGTLHAVYTIENAISFGGHCYPSSTMTQTLVTLIHTWFCQPYVTNTDPDADIPFLNRMVAFLHQHFVTSNSSTDSRISQHIPELSDLQSALNILSACAIVILGHVFDEDTFAFPSDFVQDNKVRDKRTFDASYSVQMARMKTYDLNNVPDVRRRTRIHFRGLAWSIVEWLKCCVIFSCDAGVGTQKQPNRPTVDEQGRFDPYTFIIVPFLGHLGSAIIQYDQARRASKVSHDLVYDHSFFADQVHGCFDEHPAIQRWMEDHPAQTTIIRDFGFDCVLTVKSPANKARTIHSGMTRGDKKYFYGREVKWWVGAEDSRSIVKESLLEGKQIIYVLDSEDSGSEDDEDGIRVDNNDPEILVNNDSVALGRPSKRIRIGSSSETPTPLTGPPPPTTSPTTHVP